MSKADRNRQAARAKIAQMQAAEARRRRRRAWIAEAGAAVLVILAATPITLAVTRGSGAPATAGGGTPKLKLAALSTLGALRPAPAAGPARPEGVPVPAGPPLASVAGGAAGAKVDGISCQASEQSLFHIHAYLAVFVNGAESQVPSDIGISGTCLYWLHTHDADGVIHIESPVHRTFTLGQFFDEWGQPLDPGQAGPATGHVTALYNGKVYQGNPRDIPLAAHAQIQIEVGAPLIAPRAVTFPGSL